MIIHADMDAFYASVEIRERPELADKPVVVGGTPSGRGVVAAANYIARGYGIHSAMPTATALKRCPHLVILSGRIDFYATVAKQIRDIFYHYTPLIEPLSLDEAFLDVNASEALFGDVETIAQQIKKEIADNLNLVVSIGIAPNKFIAKIASDIDKPDGFVIVKEGQQQDFLDPLPVSRIWGVGKVTGSVLANLKIKTIFDLRQLSRELLVEKFGQHGIQLWDLAQGIDDREVIPSHEAKSISHEATFSKDLSDQKELLAQLMNLTEKVSSRLRSGNLCARTVHLKIRFQDFKTITRSDTLTTATNSTQSIWHSAKSMFTLRLPKKHKAIRLIGVGVSGINPSNDAVQSQQDLFGMTDTKQRTVDEVTDKINQRYGSTTVRRGSVVKISDNE